MVLRTAFALLACAAVVAAGYVGWRQYGQRSQPAAGPAAPTIESDDSRPTDQIILSEQAQKNLDLVAKPLRTQVYWKTITVPGMIVDQPGLSDREIVAPASGTIKELFHVPGDSVRPGDALFALQLTSEFVHQTQASLFKTTQELKLAGAKLERLASGGAAIPGARKIEAQSDIARLEASAKAMREELRLHCFSDANLAAAARGDLVTELIVCTPSAMGRQSGAAHSSLATFGVPADEQPDFAYEVQSLAVDLGQHVDVGQPLCRLSSHVALAVEGRAFRDETHLLERSVELQWPVAVDFRRRPKPLRARWRARRRGGNPTGECLPVGLRPSRVSPWHSVCHPEAQRRGSEGLVKSQTALNFSSTCLG